MLQGPCIQRIKVADVRFPHTAPYRRTRVVAAPWPTKTGNGTWQQYVTLPEAALQPVPEGLSDEAASQFLVSCTGVGTDAVRQEVLVTPHTCLSPIAMPHAQPTLPALPIRVQCQVKIASVPCRSTP